MLIATNRTRQQGSRHCCTGQALRSRSCCPYLHSWPRARSPTSRLSSEFTRVGIASNEGPRLTSTRARDQLRRLCLTSYAYYEVSRDRERNIIVADNWVTWPSRGVQVTPDERFYAMARSRFVPLDAAILDGLGRSPLLAMDAYVWLTYWVSRLTRENIVTRRSLAVQFGGEYKHSRHFRWKFRRRLVTIKKLWAELEAESQEGLLNQPCARSVLSDLALGVLSCRRPSYCRGNDSLDSTYSNCSSESASNFR